MPNITKFRTISLFLDNAYPQISMMVAVSLTNTFWELLRSGLLLPGLSLAQDLCTGRGAGWFIAEEAANQSLPLPTEPSCSLDPEEVTCQQKTKAAERLGLHAG